MKRRNGRCAAALLGVGSLSYFAVACRISGLDTSGLWVWPLFGVLCMGTSAALTWMGRRGLRCRDYLLWRIGMVFTALLFLCFFLFETGVVWGMAQHGTPGSRKGIQQEMPDGNPAEAEGLQEIGTEDSLDYVLILGGGVVGNTPSPALRTRIETAAEYLKEHPQTRAVASGGLGGGAISEGACIRQELVRIGIDDGRILTEEQSKTTAENMQFSAALMEEGAGVGIVTSNFHIFRSLLTAKKAGIEHVCGIAAPFGGWMLPHYMVREFMTFTVDVFRGNIL